MPVHKHQKHKRSTAALIKNPLDRIYYIHKHAPIRVALIKRISTLVRQSMQKAPPAVFLMLATRELICTLEKKTKQTQLMVKQIQRNKV